MPVFDRFAPALARPLPVFYIFSGRDTALASRLRLHGVQMEEAIANPRSGPGEAFVVDSIGRAARTFQGHNEVRLAGRWQPGPGSSGQIFIVRTDRPLGRLAAYLLDPESDDGFATWNLFDSALHVGRPYPVRRYQ
jgi:hypothetical protein